MNKDNSPYYLACRQRYQNKSLVPSKYDTIKDSVKTVGKEYCSESSICGLKHLVNDNTTHMERIIWVIILISALICSASLVWVTFSKYYKAPLVTTQMPEGVSVSTIIFPAVGICSNNRISKRAVTDLADKLLKEERNKKYNKTEMISLLFSLGQLYNLQGLSEMKGNNMRAKQLHIALGDYDVTELMRDLTPHCDDLLLRCAWNEKPQGCSQLFNFRLTMNGFCCTFNYLRQSDIFEDRSSGHRSIDMYKYGNKSSFDFDMGLKVLLKIDESDDFYYNIPSLGSTLQFSDAYDFPDAPSGSFSMKIISPSVEMTVMVTASFTEASRDIQHVSVKLRSCLFYDESSYLPFYTHSDCMLKCRMLFLLENCNCTPFNMPKINNGRTCDMQDIPCLAIYYAQSVTVRPVVEEIPPELELDKVGGGIPCPMCYPTCSKTMYNYEFNNVVIYPDYLNSLHDEDRENWLVGANFTGTSIVHIKYAEEVADCYGQNVIMKWFDLISNIGSTCGFVTGFSFVSVLEFFYFFTVKLYREVNRRNRQRHRDLIAQQTLTAQWKPITRYRPIYWNELGNNIRSNMDTNVKRYAEIWWNGIKRLPETTSIHGFRFITDSKRHWVERIFWLIFVAMSWYGSSLLIEAQYDAFQNNPISFVVETTYKDWQTQFPSVAVCEHDNSARIEHVSDMLWGEDHDFNMEEVLKELAYFKGITYYTSQFCGLEDPLPDCPKHNLTYYASLVRSPCEEMLSNCSWNDQPFSCCDFFRPLDTELGTCFAVNTIQGREVNAPRFPMISNTTTGPGAIKFNVLVSANVYVLNEEEVPSQTTLGSDVLTIAPEVSQKRYISIRNIANDEAARFISPVKRKCRYTDENFLDVYRHYSYSACTVQCRKDAQIRFCNCTNYFTPNVPKHLKCDVEGIICLNNHINELSVLKAKWSNRPGLYCDCLPSCTEAEILVVKDFKLSTVTEFAAVHIELAILPSERYKRNVVRGILDLVVSTGGTGGLFLGASILSFVEFLYILLLRPFCDIYSQKGVDHWHKKFGNRRLEDNKFVPNKEWSYREGNVGGGSNKAKLRLGVFKR